MAKSSMVAIMGRMAAYTGQRVTWEEAINSDEVLIPDSIAWGEIPNSGVVALPGITRLTCSYLWDISTGLANTESGFTNNFALNFVLNYHLFYYFVLELCM